MWRRLRPVYQYFSEKYPQDHLFDMYEDFVQENRKVLERNSTLDLITPFIQIIENDHFAARFRQDPYYDLILDFYRLEKLKNAALNAEGHPVSEILSFSPADISNGTRLQDISRCIAVVTCYLNEEKKVSIKIRKISKWSPVVCRTLYMVWKVFGYTVSNTRGKPTNSECIALIAAEVFGSGNFLIVLQRFSGFFLWLVSATNSWQLTNFLQNAYYSNKNSCFRGWFCLPQSRCFCYKKRLFSIWWKHLWYFVHFVNTESVYLGCK